MSVVGVDLADKLVNGLSDLLTSLLDLLEDLFDLALTLLLQTHHVVNLLKRKLSSDEIVEIGLRAGSAFASIPLIVFRHSSIIY